MDNRFAGYVKVLLAMLIWGSVGIFVRFAEQSAPTIVFFRVLTAFFVLAGYMSAVGQRPYLGPARGRALLSGVVLSLNWLFFFKALQTTTIGNAVLTYYMAPIFSMVWARIFLKERLERRALFAMALSVCGILLMLSGYEFSLSSADFLGITFGLAGALFYSIVIVMVKQMPQIAPNTIVVTQMGVSSLIFLPLVLMAPPMLTLPSFASMAFMGIVHSALALGLYFSGLHSVKVQHASILSYVDPVSALIYAYLIFGEIPTLYTALGGSCILVASLLILKPSPTKEAETL